jgi:glycosyltransferase involved in cell wall biosynthesis
MNPKPTAPLVSLSWALDLGIGPAAVLQGVRVSKRQSDWGLIGRKKVTHHIREALRLCVSEYKTETLILCNVGIEAAVAGAFRKVFRHPKKLIVVDFLLPKTLQHPRLLSWFLSGVSRFVCIRSADQKVLHDRFGVNNCDTSFAFLPVPLMDKAFESTDGEPYIYSGGIAHRDWATLLAALNELPYRSVVSIGDGTASSWPTNHHVTILEGVTPEEGRRLTAGAAVVVVALKDVPLPAGPLVLLDAMAMGKPIVATDSGGTRDYIENGVTAIITPSRDVGALQRAIDGLMKNNKARVLLGEHARTQARRQFTSEHFLSAILEVAARI